MEEWKECTVGDICESVSDTYSRKDENVVLINTSDVLEGKFLTHATTKNENLKGQFKKTFQKNDILYSEIRPANRRYAFVDFEKTENYIASTKLMVIRPNKELVLPRFLYLLLTSNNLINEMQHLAETRSGTFPQITFSGELATFPISLPPLPTQQKIAAILSSLDDEIELNNKINTNLEQQAGALFKNWFVDFEPFGGKMPDEWKEVEFRDVCENITDGVHNTVVDDPNGEYLLLSCKNIKGGVLTISSSERKINKETFEKLRKRTKLAKGDILLSSVGTVGEMYLLNETPDNYEFQRSVAIIKPNTSLISPAFLYESMLFQKDTIIHSAHGAVQQCIFISDVGDFTTILPTIDIIEKFTKIVQPMLDTITANQHVNSKLANIRDTLLSKLINGEIDV